MVKYFTIGAVYSVAISCTKCAATPHCERCATGGAGCGVCVSGTGAESAEKFAESVDFTIVKSLLSNPFPQ
jgi:hypothetical protein